MLNAQFITMLPSVLVFLHTGGILIRLVVVQNVFTVVTVHHILHALTNTAEILALEFVEQMLNVLLQTTYQSAAVLEVLMEIHSVDVEKINQSTFHLNLQTPANLLLVVLIHYAVLLMEDLLVLV